MAYTLVLKSHITIDTVTIMASRTMDSLIIISVLITESRIMSTPTTMEEDMLDNLAMESRINTVILTILVITITMNLTITRSLILNLSYITSSHTTRDHITRNHTTMDHTTRNH
eukprot:scpid82463/ scgid19938/ 